MQSVYYFHWAMLPIIYDKVDVLYVINLLASHAAVEFAIFFCCAQ